jgi:Tfp pilus assembly PilM family ATPase
MAIFKKKTLTIHLEEGEARAVVLQGRRVTDWAAEPIPPGVISSGVVENPQELAALLNRLRKQVRSNSSQPLVSLSGVHQVVRILNLPRLKRELLVQAINGEMRRELASPIEEYQIHWLPVESTNTHVKVYVLAVPANELDSYKRAFKIAGLKPRRINLEAMALASSIDARDAVIIGIRDNGSSIVVVQDGVPTALRDVSYSDEILSSIDRMADLTREVQLTLASFDSEQEDSVVPSPTSTYLVGKHIQENRLTEYLSHEIGLTARELNFPIDYPEDFPVAEYAPNVGLALSSHDRSLFSRHKADFSFNLAAPEKLPSNIPVLQVAMLMLVVLASVGVVNPMRATLGPDTEEAQLRSQVVQLETRTGEIRDQLRRTRQIESALAQDVVDPQQIQLGLAEMTSDQLSWTSVIPDAQSANPDVDLLKFAEDDHNMTISAQAPNAQTAATFADYVTEIGRFSSVTVQSITLEAPESGDNRVLFDLIADKGD